MAKKALIYGSAAFGKQYLHLIKSYAPEYQIEGFIDDSKAIGTTVLGDYEVVGSFQSLRDQFKPQTHCLFLAIGYDNLKVRRKIFQSCKDLDYDFPNIVHPKAITEPDIKMGDGNLILAGAIIDQAVTIKDINVIDIGVLVGHDNHIHSNNYFSNGTVLSGFCKIGKDNFFGAHTTMTDSVEVGCNNFFNARSYIRKDLGDDTIMIPMITQKEFRN